MAVARLVLGGDAAEIALIAAAVDLRVAVQGFPPVAAARQADAVERPRHRREIQNDDGLVLAIRRLAQEGQHAVLAVGAVNPAEAGVVVIRLPEGG